MDSIIKKNYCKRFIPKSSPIQPNMYRIVGLNYAAVFSVSTNDSRYWCAEHNGTAMFYIELTTHAEYREYWDDVLVIRQYPDCRRVMYRAKSIKDAIEYLKPILEKVGNFGK